MQTILINLNVPQGWHELDDAQLRYVYSLIAKEFAADEIKTLARDMADRGSHLLYTHLTGGSHRATWGVAYDIQGVKEWLFQQRRKQ